MRYLGWLAYLEMMEKREFRGWLFLYRGNVMGLKMSTVILRALIFLSSDIRQKPQPDKIADYSEDY